MKVSSKLGSSLTVLNYLRRNRESCFSSKEISFVIGYGLSTVTYMLYRLEKIGVVSKLRCKDASGRFVTVWRAKN